MSRKVFGGQGAFPELLFSGYVVFDSALVRERLKGKERFSPKDSTYCMEKKYQYALRRQLTPISS